MIIDAHAHVYPDSIAPRASGGIAAFYDMPVRFDGRVDTLLRLGDEAGIDRALICSVAVTPAVVGNINQFIAKTVREHPGRFIGFATLHPDSADLRGDFERAMGAGLVGVKLHADFQRCALDDVRTYRVFEIIAGRAPILMHIGDRRYSYSHPAQAAALLRAFPEATVIGAHLGGWSEWDEACEELIGFQNLYVDTCSSLYELAPARAKEIIRRFGCERVLFGADYPMWDPGVEIGWLRGLGLTEGEERLILGENAFRLFP